jgi:serine/threonine protein kinase
LKPANVVIGNDSNEAHFIYLIDFGLAKKESSTNPPIDTSKNRNGQTTGGADNDPETLVDPKTGKKKTAMQTLKEFMLEE